MDQQQQAQQIAHLVTAMMPIFFLVGLLIVAFIIFLFWRVFSRAGMPGALGLIVLVPVIGWVICLCVLAFAEWKVVPAIEAGYPPTYPPPSYPPSSFPPAAPPTQL